MIDEIIGQGLGFLAMVLTIISYQMNTKSSYLMISTVATLSTCLGFLFLGASSGFALNIVCLLRNISYYFVKEKSMACYILAAVMTLGMCFAGVLSWQGAKSLLIIIPLMVNTVFLSLGIPQLLRKSVIFTSSFVLLYNVLVFSIGGILNEAVSIISSIVGIVRFRKSKAG